ncbi:15570_t:CDS:2 [Cetraspora pellucida]|uniref:15570_t:CDS:1 n=1 Tax=Cetraspora pellucida TaxID=1433469 RepID=A0A9N9NP40_9GLOM|nr:15570_t:CDS:2 [Cetraspora pellucida]
MQSNIVEIKNPQLSKTKTKSNRYKQCNEYGHNIRSCEKKLNKSELENSSTNSELDNNENIVIKQRAESSSNSSESENNEDLMQK